ncbi:hypothetical protein ACIG56_09225 [Nocardia fusca]|uniref:hypothetical protein n=1 Tax=Nocardia fusca TaxID=941183 RepID=UPI0037CB6E59
MSASSCRAILGQSGARGVVAAGSFRYGIPRRSETATGPDDQRADATLRVVAEYADLWHIPGGDIGDAVDRSARLDRYCADLGRDPAEIGRSIFLPVSYERPDSTRSAIDEALAAGFGHIVLGLPAPYPDGVARWVADQFVPAAVRVPATTGAADGAFS